MTTGQNLTALMRGSAVGRNDAEISMAALARDLGIDKGTVWRWRNDENDMSLNMATRLAEALTNRLGRHVTLDELVGRQPDAGTDGLADPDADDRADRMRAAAQMMRDGKSQQPRQEDSG
jgi:transcriptional regulator with XRE-family HTH domain